MIPEQIISLVARHLELRAEQDQMLLKQLGELLKYGLEQGQIH